MCSRLSSSDPSPAAGPQADRWIDLCAIDAVPDNGGAFMAVENRGVAVFRIAGEVRAVDDRCPHAGGSLSGGFVTDGCVICPWHGWPFDVTTGRCPDNGQWRIKVYSVRIVNDRVQIRWPAGANDE